MTTAAQFNRIDADGRAFVEFQKLRLELAWRHFEFHARQRTTMFHFFVLLVPLLIGGFFYILRENVAPGASAATTSALAANATTAATLVTAIGAVLSFVFLAFDMRNRQLYRMSQDNLRLLENDFLYAEAYTPLNYNTSLGDQIRFHGIITEEENRYERGVLNIVIKHKFLMPILYLLAFAIFAFLALCLHVKWL